MPTDVVVIFLTGHLDLLDMIPASAKGILKRVMQQKELLRAIPIELHVKLARKKIVQEIVDKYTLLDILEAHPTLIARVDPELIGPYLKFLEDPWFKERLPCETVRAATNHPTLLSLIPDRNLAQIITCRHIVSCIERKELERLLAVSNLGSRLKLSTLMVTASNLRLSQLSLRAALNFVTKQVPQSNSQLFFN
ncbi:uncharacterized protein LOC111708116 [Eurytemora carolleeae]|uniref:uncharacterized protein LOC111708116 n=1 Tax=Eurytemora carolleeae TaxID=1294199 RepID=UPI000C782E45|nr:uncharacterized protein LOC111708116 [Eurytemora carolleeae]|eukprot:XP_023337157.1 uncharacterized protein LOC111708116 [Eurytemora affinis]